MILAKSTGLLIVGIILIIFLIGLFFVSYLLNKRTPIPKGCEQIAYDVQSCSGCKETSCEYHIRAEEMLKKMQTEMKEKEK